MALCFVCAFRDRTPEVGTKSLTDKGGMRSIAHKMVDKCFAGGPDRTLAYGMQRMSWVREQVNEVMICANCFRWFFTAPEEDLKRLELLYAEEPMRFPGKAEKEDGPTPQKKRVHDVTSSDDEELLRPAHKHVKKTNSDCALPSPDHFVWPDLAQWCEPPQHSMMEFENEESEPPKYSASCEHFYWRGFHIYPVRYWGTSDKQLDKLAKCVYDKWVEDGIWDEDERDEEESCYAISDFDVYDAHKNCYPLRMEFCDGNGGLNTGCWGTVRLRTSGQLVVTIEDEDCDSHTKFVLNESNPACRAFVQFPDADFATADELQSVVNYTSASYATNHQLEKIIAAAGSLGAGHFPDAKVRYFLPGFYFRPAPHDVCVRYQEGALALAFGRIFPKEVLVVLASLSPALVFVKFSSSIVRY